MNTILLKKNNNLNIFHANVNGLEAKLDILEEFVSATPKKLDIVAITETSEKEEIGFLTNTDIEGYDFYHTSSKTSKGGTAIYVNKRFNTLEHCDLNINPLLSTGRFIGPGYTKCCCRRADLSARCVRGFIL